MKICWLSFKFKLIITKLSAFRHNSLLVLFSGTTGSLSVFSSSDSTQILATVYVPFD